MINNLIRVWLKVYAATAKRKRIVKSKEWRWEEEQLIHCCPVSCLLLICGLLLTAVSGSTDLFCRLLIVCRRPHSLTVLCMCSLCITVRRSALTQFGTSWLGIGGNGSRLELHQNAQHELCHLKHAVKQPVMTSVGHSFTDDLLRRDTMTCCWVWGTKCKM